MVKRFACSKRLAVFSEKFVQLLMGMSEGAFAPIYSRNSNYRSPNRPKQTRLNVLHLMTQHNCLPMKLLPFNPELTKAVWEVIARIHGLHCSFWRGFAAGYQTTAR